MQDLRCVVQDLLVVACMWDLVHPPGIEPRPPELGARSLTHWTTKEVPTIYLLLSKQKQTKKQRDVN